MTREQDLEFIADSLEVRAGQTVLEIGPGLGALTRVLLKKGFRVYAVEKDKKLADFLKNEFQGLPFEVFCSDILLFEPAKEIKGVLPQVAVGNIPYNITSPILFWLVKNRYLFERAVLTIQKEVADRLTGSPGNKTWGALSVSVQAYAQASFLKVISRGNFRPVPKVDSAVVRLDFLKNPRYQEGLEEFFHEIVAKAFQKRRKTLLNALENQNRGLVRGLLRDVFLEAKLDLNQRPETLNLDQWALLALCLSKRLKA